MSIHAVITGASGFIGSAAAADLLASGHKVTALLRADSNPERLRILRGIQTIQYHHLGDPATAAALKAIRPDVFLHCAWRGVGGQDRNQPFQVRDNILLAMDSVSLAAAAGCQRWIGLGSQAEYGNQNRRLDEEAPVRPTTLYGRAKLASGIACLALAETGGLSAAWLRVFSIYGPGDSPHWFLQYALREFRAGRSPDLTLCTQLWDYLHVADAARAITATATTTSATGTFNLGSGVARPLRFWLDLLRAATGSASEPNYGAVPFRHDQVMHLEADITRISSATGWVPSISPADGIATLVAGP